MKELIKKYEELYDLAYFNSSDWTNEDWERKEQLLRDISSLKQTAKEVKSPYGENIVIGIDMNKRRTEKEMADTIEAVKKSLEPKEVQPSEEVEDLKQHITNLLYYAHVEAMSMHSIDFDKWVEEQTNNLSEFYASQLPKVTDKDIEEWANEHNVTHSLGNDDLLQEMFRKGLIRGAIQLRDGAITHKNK